MATKTVDEKIRESQLKIEKEKQKLKKYVAMEHDRKRKARNHRIFTIGGMVDAILKGRFPEDPIDEYEKTVTRLIQIGLAVDEVAGHPVDAQIIKYFLQNQQERGGYFSRFLEQRETESDGES